MDVVMNVEDGDGISDIVIDGDRFQMRESYVVMIIVKEFSKDFKRFQKISKDFKRFQENSLTRNNKRIYDQVRIYSKGIQVW